jgi:hypothetical protein
MGSDSGSTRELRRAVRDTSRTITGAIDGLSDEPNLRTLVLWGVTQAAAEHAVSITALVTRGSVRSSKVLLRTIIEGWIVAKYVVHVDNDERARAYVLKEPQATLRLFIRLRKLIERVPDKEQWILSSAGLASMKELKEREATTAAEINDLRVRRVPEPFPQISTCARSLGPETEVTYASVYGYLLSDQVHVGARDALEKRLGAGREDGDESRVLITTLFLLTELAEEVSIRSACPTTRQLRRMKQRLERLASQERKAR